ncbi:unnamed protein product [Cladocopium goreaui]|uniref:Uncharacterized protein n=1 Tax=Cladocopium goreaui TaxID=2562237 RepID=A0A9P1CXE1_9DINO|nr:unnamed protein product [Cladocopium goreaui]
MPPLATFGIPPPSPGFPPLHYGFPRRSSVRRVRCVLRRAEADDRLVLVAVVAILWNVLVITLALLAEIGDTERRERGASFRSLKKRTWGLQSLQQADGPIPRLIPSLEELGWVGEKETSSTWSPSKDDLDEGILRSEGFQSSFAVSELTNPPKAASNSKDLVVFGSFFPRQAQAQLALLALRVTWSLLQRFLSNEEERRFARKAVLFLATASADAQEEKFWKHKAALLLTLARLGADRGTLLAALLDGDNDAARQDALTPLLMDSLGIEVGYLLDERQAGDPGEKHHIGSSRC